MKAMGFSRSRRMTNSSDYTRLFEGPHVYRARAFQAYWKDGATSRFRLGITLKGRVSSIGRVRIKRLVRQWFRCRFIETGDQNQRALDINIVIKVAGYAGWNFVDSLQRELYAWQIQK